MARLADYQVLDKIGQGGMALVYKGRQTSLNRSVAIKVLSPKFCQDPSFVERFNRESLIIARLRHPNIIHVIDRGISDGRPYFIMEFIEGTDLAKVIKENTKTLREKTEIIVQVCKALAYAHKNGVIHRDIKPGNILLDPEGNALVADFGIAHLFQGDDPDRNHGDGPVVMGTPRYMSPEQRVDSSTVTAASDVYSLGVVMHELFTGQRFEGTATTPSVVNPELPSGLDAVITRCLESDPARRVASADELKDHLLEAIQGAHLAQAQKQSALQGLANLQNKFALLDVIKQDRHGAVYLFEDRGDHRLMVIKKVVGKTGGLREAKLLHALRHPRIVPIYGVSSMDTQFIIVMEYVTGGSLRDRLAKVRPWHEGLAVARDIFEGLSFAHKNHVVHGNLRPSNVLIAEDGHVKLTDFGLDEHYGPGGAQGNWYHPPDEPRSQAADIYAAGMIVYEMVTGSLPSWNHCKLVHHETFRTLPPDVQTLLTTMVSRDVSQRYANVDEVLAALTRGSQRSGASVANARSHDRRGKTRRVLIIAAVAIGGAVMAALALRFLPALRTFLSQITQRIP
ncbi:MAG: protein kinase domain-containing protein [Nitrospirota bacterium]